jgi:hypothetical protein
MARRPTPRTNRINNTHTAPAPRPIARTGESVSGASDPTQPLWEHLVPQVESDSLTSAEKEQDDEYPGSLWGG